MKEKKETKIAYQRFINGKKVVVLASTLKEANELFNKLTK